MRSKASIDGHPVHPALIPFPFAFLCGGAAFDLAGWLFARPTWWTTGYHLALTGLATAVLAAIPGFVDYAATVPRRGRVRRRATRHMVLVLGSVVMFAAALLARDAAVREPTILALALEAVGVVLLVAGGSLGGELVFRDRISVDEGTGGGQPIADGAAEGVHGRGVRRSRSSQGDRERRPASS